MVESVVPEFEGRVGWEKIVIKTRVGAARFRALGKALGRFPPVPSVVVGGELAFSAIPSVEALREYLKDRLGRDSSHPQVGGVP